jgi:hypothetical protein
MYYLIHMRTFSYGIPVAVLSFSDIKLLKVLEALQRPLVAFHHRFHFSFRFCLRHT